MQGYSLFFFVSASWSVGYMQGHILHGKMWYLFPFNARCLPRAESCLLWADGTTYPDGLDLSRMGHTTFLTSAECFNQLLEWEIMGERKKAKFSYGLLLMFWAGWADQAVWTEVWNCQQLIFRVAKLNQRLAMFWPTPAFVLLAINQQHAVVSMVSQAVIAMWAK